VNFLDRIFGKRRINFPPYSADSKVKQEQVQANLQKGILLEDTGVFIPWSTTYRNIGRHAKERVQGGDRTIWFLGEHRILGGLTCNIRVYNFFQPDSSSFDAFMEDLGHDEAGREGFLVCLEHLTALFGEPGNSGMELFHKDEREAQWILGKVRIRLVAAVIFSCRHRLEVGLIDNSQDRDLKRGIAALKAEGWTDEELGK
jgi:hypothetical protein